jgi:hypothetical protein
VEPADYITNAKPKPYGGQEKRRVLFVLLSSIEPMDLINSFTGSMVLLLLLLLLPINESGCQPTFYTAEYHFMQNPPNMYYLKNGNKETKLQILQTSYTL